jgi:cytochrome c
MKLSDKGRRTAAAAMGAATLALLTPQAWAAPNYAAVQPLLAKNNCLACHAVDKKIVGPAYQEVATKYKGRADASAYLSQKIKAGSVGVWGPVPMPPNVAVSDADRKTIADWLAAGAVAK